MLTIDLTGKVALVTGATGELGSVIATTLAHCGASVGVHFHRSQNVAENLCSRISSAGGSARPIQADISRKPDVERMRDTLRATLGNPDVVVTAAVVQYRPWQSVLDEPLENYESQFASSVLHNVLIAKTFVPHMITQGWGRVIGINTECSMQCWEKQSAYVAGKRGMDGVLRVLAREVGPHNITVNQIAPGWIASQNRPEDGSPFQNSYKAAIPLRRRGSAQDVANSVAFLASDLANFTTGLYLTVCGGNVMPAI